MPFRSLKQMRMMYAAKPKLAKKWHDETKKEGGKFPTKSKKYAHGRTTSPKLKKKYAKKDTMSARNKKGPTKSGTKKKGTRTKKR
jgi:hypothetical protein